MAFSCKPIFAVAIATMAVSSCASNQTVERELPRPLNYHARSAKGKDNSKATLSREVKDQFTEEYNSGSKLLNLGKYKEAKAHLERAIEHGEKTGKNSLNQAKFDLCRCYSMMGDLDRAMALGKELLEFYKDKPLARGEVENLIGTVYEKMEKLELSKEYFLKALASYKSAKKLPKGQILQVENNLALLNLRSGNFEQAAREFEKILEKADQSKELSDLSFVSTRINLGVCYTELNKYEEAFKQLTLARKKAEKTFGKKHYYYGKVLYCIAHLYVIEKNYKEAIKYCEEAITIFEGANAKRDLLSALRVDYQLLTITRSFDKAKEINERIQTLSAPKP